MINPILKQELNDHLSSDPYDSYLDMDDTAPFLTTWLISGTAKNSLLYLEYDESGINEDISLHKVSRLPLGHQIEYIREQLDRNFGRFIYLNLD